ncbi:MAG: choice-of-anchor B family protein [Hymenobacteraceae bacterium]|nr:choice-of-anchor B family protein [Hymenobacteraceae bacterium]MDX5397850.1 choice-of-anchor B family protein [Hymenobacteraceae bacterium]MDX5513922.1 choice-of-anchor B family protein [Hymenobacteraceae bacterium]
MKKLFYAVLAIVFTAPTFEGKAQISQNVQMLYNWKDTAIPGSFLYNNAYNEVWGAVVNNREFAIIGSTLGTHIFDVTNPAATSLSAFVPGKAQGRGIIHRDYKTYRNFLYAVSDEGQSSLQIIDLSQLPAAAPVVYDSDSLLVNCHNIFIDTATAKLYACAVRGRDSSGQSVNVGLQVYSLANPVRPQLLANYNAAGVVHDAFVRNDTAFLNAGGIGLRVVNFSNPANPVLLGQLSQYPFKGYNHSGWLSADGNTYVFADETHGAELKVTDVQNLSNIQVISTFTSGITSNSIPHNQVVKGNYVFVSYYYDGLQIFDISNPAYPVKVGFYDTYPDPNTVSYQGAWGVYPFLPSGNILVSDMQYGLFVFKVAGAVSGTQNEQMSSLPLQVYPNPFTSQLTLQMPDEVLHTTNKSLTLTDMLGREVYAIKLMPDQQVVNLPESITAGVYQLHVKTGEHQWIRKVVRQ